VSHQGYIPRRTKQVESSLPTAEGAEPFRATIVTSLSFAEIEAIPFGEHVTYRDMFEAIHPYVVAWNALGFNLETRQYEPVPPPAEAGAAAFQAVDPSVATFLAFKLKTVHLGDDKDRPKGSTPSAPTPDGTSDDGSTSRAPAKSRKSRTATTSTNGSI
jgi:hypothetical protein